ncbi:related to homocysteine S-methyltransferase [Rhynchosporium agropyri]|uniref:Related to homocysteine S-methyltransferase n=1 Tax=Rhynchosporium agropyri TaxID=914238 RepID=A0A1E1K890_9HELO|nr:related to homocysteine S-methyltransferase [Rhynchosporium agropyri]
MPPPIILLDGGLGTTLADQHDCKFDHNTPLWSSHLLISDPSILSAVQTAFAEAGANVLLSATYQASFEGFERTRIGSGDETGENEGIDEKEAGRFMRNGISIAREAFYSASQNTGDGHGRGNGGVALSLGAYGATMIPSQEYTGKYDEARLSVNALQAWHAKRLGAFTPIVGMGGGSGSDSLEDEEKRRCWQDVDLVAFETLPLKEEITAVRRVMGQLSPTDGVDSKDFWISCVFPGERMCLPDGSKVGEIVRLMLEQGEGLSVPLAVGINCTKVGKLEGLVEEFEREVGRLVEGGDVEWPALVLYPDGTDGEVYDTTRKEWVKSAGVSKSVMSWDETVFGIVDRAQKRGFWNSIIVGGCCKTTPEDISKLRRRIDQAS